MELAELISLDSPGIADFNHARYIVKTRIQSSGVRGTQGPHTGGSTPA